ncbi:MAG TPA: hypothetical protein VMU88_07525 [bacterium]|nr:hypothetical protein [bacterium]
MLFSIFAIILFLFSVVESFFSIKLATIIFVLAEYFAFIFLLLGNQLVKPRREVLRAMSTFATFDNDELHIVRKYFLYIRYTFAGRDFSWGLNCFRLTGIFWAIFDFCKGYYWVGGAIAIFYLLASGLIVILDPYTYYSIETKKGNKFAMRQLEVIKRAQEKIEQYS